MFSFSKSVYRYIHNLQGDIVAIVDAAGNPVVEYKYDAWGDTLSITRTLKTTLGQLNPFRYRGYSFDIETGLYYLDKRYYSPNTCRFMNSDLVFIFTVTEASALLKHNLFAYCKNNPVMEYDPLGIWSWKSVFKVAITAVVVGAVAIAAASGGVALAATATVAMGCSTVGGMLSAKAAGGKYEDGALAGACGGVAALAMGTVSSNPVHSRVTGSLVYDVVYEKLATGSVDPESLALTAVDVGLDYATSGLYYGCADDLIGESAQNLARGALDGITDVAQTTIVYNRIPKGTISSAQKTKATPSTQIYQKYGGVRNMQMEIAFMLG